mmetsp:Transcript_9202/g.19417  ORF Transcript_9202/g.19417 Transcript_9202/m.19417 type:complete len:531 (+) Transcript_9202:199-1791(+)
MPMQKIESRLELLAEELEADHLDQGGARPDGLTVFVVGASGDLAKKKTYPSLFDLFRHNFLTDHTIICGYARSTKSTADFRDQILPYLKGGTEEEKLAFLSKCIYRNGNYDSAEDVGNVFGELKQLESGTGCGKFNRLFYFAIPPSVFVPIGKSLKEAVIGNSHEDPNVGWSRLIVEKPFGRDSESFRDLSSAMSDLYTEDYIYRIDHYLGKEMVQNLVILRFANAIFEPLWNRDHIKSVTITFKEDFGTKGRGGYFDSSGIIRDVIQNHLIQILSLVAMEPPVAVTGDQDSASFVRDEKVKVLNCIDPVKLDDCVLGQYLAPEDGSEPSYTGDPSVPDDSVTPTFATMVLWINNPRWDGVPFILKAGKALNERKGEIRIQFKPAPGANRMFAGQEVPRNELVMRLQPDEAVYMKANVKSPGLKTTPVMSELDLSYAERYADEEMFDAYTRLILEVIRGRQATFVRDDELKAAWAIFTPLLHRIEAERIKPIPYDFGGRGPPESDQLLKSRGYYQYHGGKYTGRGKRMSM